MSFGKIRRCGWQSGLVILSRIHRGRVSFLVVGNGVCGIVDTTYIDIYKTDISQSSDSGLVHKFFIFLEIVGSVMQALISGIVCFYLDRKSVV